MSQFLDSMFTRHLASEELKNKRLEICNSCEHNKLGVCAKCSCVLQGKVRIKSAQCPLGKWNTDKNNSTQENVEFNNVYKMDL